MSYKALTTFTDLQDDNHRYHAGDTFPREGLEVSDERLEELSSDKNRRHKPVIEKIEDDSVPVVNDDPVVDETTKPAPKKGGRKKKADAE